MIIMEGIISQVHPNSCWEWQIDDSMIKRCIQNKEELLLTSPKFNCLNEKLWNLELRVNPKSYINMGVLFNIRACSNSKNPELLLIDYVGSYAYIIIHQKNLSDKAMNVITVNLPDSAKNCMSLCNFIIESSLKSISLKGLITVHFYIHAMEKNEEKLAAPLTVNLESHSETLFNKPDFSDVQLSVGNKKFYAHKAILANFSPVFAAMFRNDMKETKENVVEISDVSAEVVDNLLKFIYSGKANINESTMYDLSYASEKYQLNNLKSLCANYLYNSLTIENCIDIACLAEKCCMDQLKYKVIIFIVHNYNLDFMNSKAFIELEQSNLKLFLEITKNCMRSNYQNKLC